MDQAAGGPPVALAARRGVLYVGEGPRLAAYDAAALGTSERLSRLGASDLLAADVSAVQLLGDMALVLQPQVGLAVVDVANPSAMTKVAELEVAAIRASMLVREPHAYVATCGGGIVIIDLSDPSNPKVIGEVQLAVPGHPDHVVCGSHMASDKDYLYAFFDDHTDLGHGSSYLAVLDLTEPTAPSVVGVISPDAKQARDVAIVDGALLALYDFDLVVVDVTAASEPRVVSRMTPPPDWGGSGLAVVGHRGYISTSTSGARSGLVVVDIADPVHPAEVGFLAVGGAMSRPVVADGLAYFTEYSGRPDGAVMLHVAGIGGTSDPRSVASAEVTGGIVDMTLNERIAYGRTAQGRLWAIALSGGGGFGSAAPVPQPWRASGLTMAAGYLVAAAGRDGVRVLDVGDPSAVRELGAALPGDADYQDNVPVSSGSFVFVLGRRPKTRLLQEMDLLRVVDLTDPGHPVEVAALQLSEGATDLALQGDRIVVAGDSGLEIVDVSNRTEPAIVGRVDTGDGARHVALVEDGLALATAGQSLLIYDLRDPGSAVQLASIPLPGQSYRHGFNPGIRCWRTGGGQDERPLPERA